MENKKEKDKAMTPYPMESKGRKRERAHKTPIGLGLKERGVDSE